MYLWTECNWKSIDWYPVSVNSCPRQYPVIALKSGIGSNTDANLTDGCGDWTISGPCLGVCAQVYHMKPTLCHILHRGTTSKYQNAVLTSQRDWALPKIFLLFSIASNSFVFVCVSRVSAVFVPYVWCSYVELLTLPCSSWFGAAEFPGPLRW